MSDLDHRFQAVKNTSDIFDSLLYFFSLNNEKLELKTQLLIPNNKCDVLTKCKICVIKCCI